MDRIARSSEKACPRHRRRRASEMPIKMPRGPSFTVDTWTPTLALKHHQTTSSASPRPRLVVWVGGRCCGSRTRGATHPPSPPRHRASHATSASPLGSHCRGRCRPRQGGPPNANALDAMNNATPISICTENTLLVVSGHLSPAHRPAYVILIDISATAACSDY